MALRPRHLAAGFGLYIVVIAWFAWQTAQQTTFAWFGAGVSLWTYALNFIAALVLAVGLGAVGVTAGRGAVDLDYLRGKLSAIRSKLVSLEVQQRGEVKEDEVDALLASLEDDPPAHSGPKVGSVVADVQELLTTAAGASVGPKPKSKLGAIAGPVSAAAGFAALSAAMIPAADGFLQINFALNTFLILTIAYGWIGLLGYTLGSAFLALRAR